MDIQGILDEILADILQTSCDDTIHDEMIYTTDVVGLGSKIELFLHLTLVLKYQ